MRGGGLRPEAIAPATPTMGWLRCPTSVLCAACWTKRSWRSFELPDWAGSPGLRSPLIWVSHDNPRGNGGVMSTTRGPAQMPPMP